jgi:hypothetical protein
MRDINDLEVDLRITNAHERVMTRYVQLNISNIVVEKETVTWAKLFELVKPN